MALAVVYTVLFVAVPCIVAWIYHVQSMGHSPTMVYLLLSLFLVINIMINVWEMALYFYSSWITEQYNALKKKLEHGQLPPVFMFQHVSVSEALSLKYWANVWLLYSFFDQSYADPKSYGFWIDSGNAFSTIVPSALFLLGMSADLMTPVHLGLVGILHFYQEAYGTVLYCWSFIHNKRWTEHGWKGSGLTMLWALVIGSNGLWLAGPGLGMWVSYRLILDGASALALVRG